MNIAAMTLLVGLCVLAQTKEDSERLLVAETSSSSAAKSAAKPTKDKPAPESSAKSKPASTTDKETKSEAKSSAAPPLASVPEPTAKNSPDKNAKDERLPFRLNDRGEMAAEAPSAGGLLLRTFGALLFIVGLIAAAGWGLRYFGIINFGKQQSEAAGLQVLDTVALGERRSLTIIKFGERLLLVGSTPQGLSLLAEQADEPERQANTMPTVRTVTDLLDTDYVPQFEQELARASLINTTWSDRRVQ